MQIRCVVCSICGTYIFSRSRHDFRWCPCENTFVDGGVTGDYIRYGGKPEQKLQLVDLKKIYKHFVKKTDKEITDLLYKDWRIASEHYGHIKGEKIGKTKKGNTDNRNTSADCP